MQYLNLRFSFRAEKCDGRIGLKPPFSFSFSLKAGKAGTGDIDIEDNDAEEGDLDKAEIGENDTEGALRLPRRPPYPTSLVVFEIGVIGGIDCVCECPDEEPVGDAILV